MSQTILDNPSSPADMVAIEGVQNTPQKHKKKTKASKESESLELQSPSIEKNDESSLDAIKTNKKKRKKTRVVETNHATDVDDKQEEGEVKKIKTEMGENGDEGLLKSPVIAAISYENESVIDRKGPVASLINCSVCFCMPEADIFQCNNGHLLCDECHASVLAGDAPLCPMCRIKLNRLNPSRNTIAECTRSHIESVCEQCEMKMPWKYLSNHVKEECMNRELVCVYSLLGCDWAGKYCHQETHTRSCDYPNKTGRELIDQVQTLQKKREEAKKRDELAAYNYSHVVKLMGTRARNIMVKDVRLERDEFIRSTVSSPFKLFGESWHAELKRSGGTGSNSRRNRHNRASNGNNDQGNIAANSTPAEISSANVEQQGESNVSPVGDSKSTEGTHLVLYRHSTRRKSAKNNGLKKLPVQMIILKGPGLPIDLSPSFFNVDFKKGEKKSKPIKLPLSPINSRQLMDCNQITLRLVFIDKRDKIDRSFTTLRNNNGTAELGNVLVGSDTDSDNDSSHTHHAHHSEHYLSLSEDDDMDDEDMDDEEGDEEGMDSNRVMYLGGGHNHPAGSPYSSRAGNSNTSSTDGAANLTPRSRHHHQHQLVDHISDSDDHYDSDCDCSHCQEANQWLTDTHSSYTDSDSQGFVSHRR